MLELAAQRPLIKICCIASLAEAQLALHEGADILGLVSQMPSGPGPIADALIAEIAAAVPASTQTFLLTCRTRADDIAAHHRATRTTALQLVDHVPHDELRKLRALCPGVRLVQVIHVLGEAGHFYGDDHVFEVMLFNGLFERQHGELKAAAIMFNVGW